MLEAIRSNAQSWGVKIAFGIIIIVFVFWGVGSMGNSSPNLVAKVNKTAITAQELMHQYEQQRNLLRQQYPDISQEDMARFGLKRQVFERLVSEILLVDKAREMGLSASPEELRVRIAAMPSFFGENGKFDGAVYERVLAGQGLTAGAFEDDITRSILLEKLVEFVTSSAVVSDAEALSMFQFSAEQRRADYRLFAVEDYKDEVAVTDEELNAFYKENIGLYQKAANAKLQYLLITPASLAKTVAVSDESVSAFYRNNAETHFVEDESVHASHILILASEKADDATIAAAKAKIDEIKAKLDGGADFAKLAKEFSQDPSAAQNAGDLGWFGRGQMVAPFEKAAFATPVGKMSDVVRTAFGFHIVKVDGKKERRVKSFDEVKDSIKANLAEEEAMDKLGTTLDAAVEGLGNGKELGELAKELGVELRESSVFTRAQAEEATGVKASAVGMIFDTPAGTTLDTPLEVDGGYMLAKILVNEGESSYPFEKVKAQVEQRVRMEKALALAKKDATKVSLALAETGILPDAEHKHVSRTAAFLRQGFIPELGQAPALANAVFAATDITKWLPEPFECPRGMVVVRLAEVLPANIADWEPIKERNMEAMLQTKKEEMYRLFMQELLDSAEVKVQNPKFLEESM